MGRKKVSERKKKEKKKEKKVERDANLTDSQKRIVRNYL